MSALTRRLYVICWLILGAIALGYFSLLFNSVRDPQKIPVAGALFTQTDEPQGAAAGVDPALTQALVRMGEEIERLRAALEAANKENKVLKGHLRTLESTFGPTTSALPPDVNLSESNPLNAEEKRVSEIDTDGAAKRVQAPQREEKPLSEAVPKVSVTMLPMPGDGFADALPESPLPLAGESEANRTLFAVELAAGLKADEVEPRWKELKQRYGKLLGGLQPRSINAAPGSQNVNLAHRLVAGPFRNAAAAARLCARLNAAGTKCRETVFAGTPVGNVAAR